MESMKAYRVYYLNDAGEKVYFCESPGYWGHHCADPTYAVPYLEIEKAQASAELDEKYVCPSGVQRHVEEYDETRPLVRYKFDGRHVRLAEFMRYFTDRPCYEAVI